MYVATAYRQYFFFLSHEFYIIKFNLHINCIKMFPSSQIAIMLMHTHIFQVPDRQQHMFD